MDIRRGEHKSQQRWPEANTRQVQGTPVPLGQPVLPCETGFCSGPLRERTAVSSVPNVLPTHCHPPRSQTSARHRLSLPRAVGTLNVDPEATLFHCRGFHSARGALTCLPLLSEHLAPTPDTQVNPRSALRNKNKDDVSVSKQVPTANGKS